MAHCPADRPSEADRAGDRGVPRRCRGRPRLTDSDRAQRRLESRKKYDVRRVYLGESHKLWSELRRRTSLSDAGLAEYLILLNNTYGDKYRQESCGKKTTAGMTGKQKGGRKQRVSSLQGLVSWYREHSASCPHEPQLRALEPKANLATTAVWRCESDHSFVQHLHSPPKEVSDSESDERGNSDGEAANKTEPPSAKGRQRRKEGNKKCKDELADATNQTEEDGGQTQQPTMEASSALPGQPAWDAASLHSASAEEDEGAALEDVEQEREGGKLKTLAPDYACSAAAEASLPDEAIEANRRSSGSVPLSSHLGMSDPPPAQAQDQTQRFQPQPLQTAAAGCELPNQRTALESSQLIIITGPSYEALASEGVQLNMGSGNMEEVTCTVIGGVAYSQLCSPDFKVRDAPEEDSLTGLSEAQLVQNSDHLELSSSRELQRSLGRSKRNRRGPVIEADGMLKMFHCPYEGCSQVYVAISSFQFTGKEEPKSALTPAAGRSSTCPTTCTVT
ncbi:zinc finger protein 653 isoform X2 [Poeciliopsis prolifica]|uniref:zinc finger protein 653 isoform X2 n=1 Tax=Poeciliopsis prolifica TaxID=188132 RepID=UPI0024132424|nr:zinc finger protein 653 isoform X2 [Poeciliopsis prolifica]